MKLTILGSGTAAPRLERNMSSYLLEVGGKKLLFDSGPGTLRQLLKVKVPITDIDHIFYTHFHNDHINDLPALLWSNNYGTKRKRALAVHGPVGFRKYCDALLKLMQIDLRFPLRIKEIPHNGSVFVSTKLNKKITIAAKESKHTNASVSYRIAFGKKSLCYSGDTDFSRDIIECARDTDLLVLECSMPDGRKVAGHLTPAECGEIARNADVKKMVLTHLYPAADREDIVKQCKRQFSGAVIKARDFMTITV